MYIRLGLLHVTTGFNEIYLQMSIEWHQSESCNIISVELRVGEKGRRDEKKSRREKEKKRKVYLLYNQPSGWTTY